MTKSKEYIFVGYCEDAKGYRLLDPEDPSKMVRARDVFIENFGNHQYPVNNDTNVPLHQVLSQESSDEVQGGYGGYGGRRGITAYREI
ncbi:hypothetical protein JTB14_030083 [Gonioctena quinquepunctata]|nr:hypothetical protein JTB14_030083 [Gonioctena quinquepunctata]